VSRDGWLASIDVSNEDARQSRLLSLEEDWLRLWQVRVCNVQLEQKKITINDLNCIIWQWQVVLLHTFSGAGPTNPSYAFERLWSADWYSATWNSVNWFSFWPDWSVCFQSVMPIAVRLSHRLTLQSSHDFVVNGVKTEAVGWTSSPRPLLQDLGKHLPYKYKSLLKRPCVSKTKHER